MGGLTPANVGSFEMLLWLGGWNTIENCNLSLALLGEGAFCKVVKLLSLYVSRMSDDVATEWMGLWRKFKKQKWITSSLYMLLVSAIAFDLRLDLSFVRYTCILLYILSSSADVTLFRANVTCTTCVQPLAERPRRIGGSILLTRVTCNLR
jgi:hypothetical protein